MCVCVCAAGAKCVLLHALPGMPGSRSLTGGANFTEQAMLRCFRVLSVSHCSKRVVAAAGEQLS